MNFGYVGVFPAGLPASLGGAKPLANNFDGAEPATTDGQAGKLFAQYASNRFAIAFLIRGGEFFGLLGCELVEQISWLT
jgi:hypothetical protein